MCFLSSGETCDAAPQNSLKGENDEGMFFDENVFQLIYAYLVR